MWHDNRERRNCKRRVKLWEFQTPPLAAPRPRKKRTLSVSQSARVKKSWLGRAWRGQDRERLELHPPVDVVRHLASISKSSVVLPEYSKRGRLRWTQDIETWKAKNEAEEAVMCSVDVDISE